MKHHGFTLLETIIVLAIMTMFFAVSIPFFSRFTESTKLDTSARSITSALRTARVYAIANNTVYYVVFDTSTDPDSYYISEDGVNPKEKKDKLPIGISFDIIGFTGGVGVNSAAFKATGELDQNTNDASVVIEDKDENKKTITVEKTTGRARIQ